MNMTASSIAPTPIAPEPKATPTEGGVVRTSIAERMFYLNLCLNLLLNSVSYAKSYRSIEAKM
jgi:hypothetical protein